MRFSILAEGLTCSYEARMGESEVLSLTADSRKATEGALFVCVGGMTVDGHDYAPEAYRRGCRLFIVEKTLDLPSDALQCKVENSRMALADLARAFYGFPDRELLLIGVTGTKGKTTVSSMASQLLCALGVKTGYIGSNGIIYGERHEESANTTPESIELYRHFRSMADDGVRAVVMEVSSQALYLGRVRGMTFPITLFTNLAVDHIGGNEHPTFDHYRQCKKSLFSDYGTECMIYNADDEAASVMREQTSALRTVGYSLANSSADLYASNLLFGDSVASMGTSFSLSDQGKHFDACLNMPGEFNVSNALGAIAVAKEVLARLACARTTEQILAHLPSLCVSGRFETVPLFDDRAFVIDYAHNGYSLEALLTTLRTYAPKRLVCLVGSVGGRTYGRRREIAHALRLCDFAIITSDNPDKEEPMQIIREIAEFCECPYTMIADRAEAIDYAVENSREGDIILLAGKGHERYQLIGGQRVPFCERELLTEAESRIQKAAKTHA